MKNGITLIFSLLFLSNILFAQKPELTYYLPDIQYNKDIPTPEEVLGYMPGEWHISHDQLVMYMRELARASDRVTIEEYARSYENRPLLLLTITSPKNHGNLENIRQQHVSLTDPNLSAKLDVNSMPVVVYQGFSIHGNEPSGGNAAPLVAYYLAAGQSKEVLNMIDDAVFLIDPCYNPDGFNRFSTWANMHKSETLVSDPQDREYDEEWPRGRTNHYWFDLNRDWLPIQHPESQGRIKNFHHWKPNVLTDHHEMGSNATFFFQPGIPSRTNPNTPQENQDLTMEIGTYHAKTLDEIGSLYYSQESFDDFYYGKGSTYPDANGSIGILFEQASSRGHIQETVNGILTFPFTIRNQVRTALSTQTASTKMRSKLLDYQRRFYSSGIDKAKGDKTKAYVFSEENDKSRLKHFLDLLAQHQIQVYKSKKNISTKGKIFYPQHSYIVPTQQNQYRLIKAIFEKVTNFKDSLFYDVSAWTLPLAYNLQFEGLESNIFSNSILGEQIKNTSEILTQTKPAVSNYAYLMEWDEYFAPTALYQLQKRGLRTKVATSDFAMDRNTPFKKGTILLPVENQLLNADQIAELVQAIAIETGVKFHAQKTGLTSQGIDFGSNSFAVLKMPKVCLLVGDGVSSYDAGEIWYQLDQRYKMPVTKIETGDVSGSNLSKYTVLVMANGSYGSISKSGIEKIKSFVKNGGTLISCRDAIRWAKNNGLASIEYKTSDNKNKFRRPYAKRSADSGSQYIGGAIFETKLDLTHPLAYGFYEETLPVFRRGTLFLKPSKNLYATPQVYTNNPLLSGYISKKNSNLIKNSASIVVSGSGRGKTICMADNPVFRAFWWGTNKLFANAVFFGHTINRGAIQRDEAANEAEEEDGHGHGHGHQH